MRTAAVLISTAMLLSGCARNAEDRGAEPSNDPPPASQPPIPDAGARQELPAVEFVLEPLPPSAGQAARPPDDRNPGPRSASVDQLRAAVAAHPDEAEAHRRLGMALLGAGQRLEAVPHFEKAAALDPRPERMLELGIAYSAVSRFPEAQDVYQRTLAAAPGHPKVLHNLANIAVKRGDVGQALAYYQLAIEADPDYLLAYSNVADLLNAAGQPERAVVAYLDVLDRSPRNPFEQRVYNDAIHKYAALVLSLGDAKQAEGLLSQLLQLQPHHEAAHYTRAQALLQLGRDDEADRELEQHMKLLARRKPSGAAATTP